MDLLLIRKGINISNCSIVNKIKTNLYPSGQSHKYHRFYKGSNFCTNKVVIRK